MAASIPQPPPPSPARREAAIEAAMRRFDGGAVEALASTPPLRPAVASWRTKLGRPQVGVLVSVLFVALVGIPVALLTVDQWSQPEQAYAPAPTADSGAGLGPGDRAPGNEPPPKVAYEAPAVPPGPAETLDLAEPKAGAQAQLQARSMPAAPPPAMARAEAQKPSAPGAADEEFVITAKRRQETSPSVGTSVTAVTNAAPAPQREADRMAEADEEESIVLTGTQRRNSRAAARGDWNACTVNDPGRSLGRCRGSVNLRARGDAGRSASHLAEGLSRAWNGDLEEAIAAFDQAIAASPRYGFAYLNRGLAYQRLGELDRAIADLNLAVRFEPSARAYFNRARLLREKGDTRRARADEDRAVDLDRRYADLIQ